MSDNPKHKVVKFSEMELDVVKFSEMKLDVVKFSEMKLDWPEPSSIQPCVFDAIQLDSKIKLAREAERLAARKWHDDTDDDNNYREYMKARERVDELEKKSDPL